MNDTHSHQHGIDSAPIQDQYTKTVEGFSSEIDSQIKTELLRNTDESSVLLEAPLEDGKSAMWQLGSRTDAKGVTYTIDDVSNAHGVLGWNRLEMGHGLAWAVVVIHDSEGKPIEHKYKLSLDDVTRAKDIYDAAKPVHGMRRLEFVDDTAPVVVPTTAELAQPKKETRGTRIKKGLGGLVYGAGKLTEKVLSDEDSGVRRLR